MTTVAWFHCFSGIAGDMALGSLVDAGADLDEIRAVAAVEGQLHRRPPEQVHFHEVGGIDAIVDIVGTCTALHLLGVDAVHASPVAHGTGMIRAAHGLLPNPPPAVVGLLRGAPTYGVDIPVE